jgi:hypothetical protein
LTASLLDEDEVFFLQLVLAGLIEREDSRGTVLELGREDRLCSIDEEEGCLTGRLGRCGTD